MLRKARIDAPGALHHIIVRGIERRKILYDNADRDNFVERSGSVLTEISTPCFAWTLIPNHIHLLLRVRATINSQILSVAAPGWQGVKEQEYQAYSELSQRRQAGCSGA